jgi:hypothetical protein
VQTKRRYGSGSITPVRSEIRTNYGKRASEVLSKAFALKRQEGFSQVEKQKLGSRESLGESPVVAVFGQDLGEFCEGHRLFVYCFDAVDQIQFLRFVIAKLVFEF